VGRLFALGDMADIDRWCGCTRDAAGLWAIHGGARFYSADENRVIHDVDPASATGQIVASAALANGNLTVANQPDVMRQVQMRVAVGDLGWHVDQLRGNVPVV
jgi:hypothetical protein